LDLYEYTSNKEVVPIVLHNDALEIENKIYEDQDCFVWIEQTPIFHLIKNDFGKQNILCEY